MWIYPILIIHSLVDGHLGCFHVSPIMNNVAINIFADVFVQTYIFISLGYMLGSGIPRLYGNPMLNFSEKRSNGFLFPIRACSV